MIEVPDTPDPWKLSAQANGELDGITEESFQETVNQQNIGKHYLRDRKRIEKAYKRSMENLITAPEPEKFREPKQNQEPRNFRKKINRPAIA